MLHGKVVAQGHFANAQEDSGPDAAQEHIRNGYVGGTHGVNNHNSAGRDDGTDDGACRSDRGSVFFPVAGLLHHFDLDLTQTGGIGGSRTGNTGKQHTAQNVDMCQTTADVPNQGITQLNDAHGQAAAAHNLCRKDEQGDGQIGKVIDARIHLLCKRDQRTVPDLKRGNGQKTHGKADRNT